MKATTRLKIWASQHQLACFITVALFIAAVMTLISLWLYLSSGAMRLDLSRPGYEEVRQKVVDNDSQQTFLPSGPLTQETAKDFQALLDEQQNQLKVMGDFNDQALSDSNVGLE
jgi:hypothetical protein